MPALPQYYGDPLTFAARQPSGTLHIDAYGLAQAQLTFALDSDPTVMGGYLTSIVNGVAYPDDLGFAMKSYKYSVSSAKANVSMVTIDYMGVDRETGWTDAQLTGVSNTSAQPIETHPAFTAASGPHPAFGGTNEAPLNKAIFVEAPVQTTGQKQYSFGGFAMAKAGEAPNPKAGIRQYLKPMVNFRGQIFFNPANADKAGQMVQAVGRLLRGSDLLIMVTPTTATGAVGEGYCLLTAANVEVIGTPENMAGVKVTYDIMVSGEGPWDSDIYWLSDAAIFS